MIGDGSREGHVWTCPNSLCAWTRVYPCISALRRAQRDHRCHAQHPGAKR